MLLKRVHMKKYLQLARVRQYIKNGLIFIPAFFEGTLFEREILLKLLAGFFAFSAVCSVVYNGVSHFIPDTGKRERICALVLVHLFSC